MSSQPTPSRPPRVTLGIAAYSHPDFLAQAIQSGLDQDYDDFELLIVDDCSPDPRVREILDSFEDPRFRVVRHPENRGMPEAFNTIVTASRGELIAMLGDDDICLPDRLSREVAIFDAHPETGVVYGDALIIDGAGEVTGEWRSADFAPAELMHFFIRRHNYLIDPTRMVHRRVYDAVGLYDPTYPLAQDLHFWLRAAPHFRFRHCSGGPLIGYRRHGNNSLEESNRDAETEAVERAVGEAIDSNSLRDLIPELDWAVLDPRDGERQALLRLAGYLDARELPLPGLAKRMRARAEAIPVRQRPAPSRAGSGAGARRLMITSFGWNDSGGGTTVPRLSAKELARRGWEVSVFYAATTLTESRIPYEVIESEQDGVRLFALHNRPHGIWDLGNPLRELDDPPITAAFAEALDRVQPEVVHFHNLHNLGAALMDEAAARGLPAFFSTHNYWLICPRAYLMRESGETCAGPGDGQRCAECVGSSDRGGHHARLEGIRARASRSLSACLTVSHAVRQTLISAGYPPELLDVVPQGMPQDGEIWERLGRERAPGRAGEPLTIGFLGSAYPHKGPQLLVRAAQKATSELRIRIHGEISEAFAAELERLDRRGVVELCGAFRASEIDRVLMGLDAAALPSTWWDCAPLAASECRAARLPLLVPRLGGLAEAVEDGVDGLVFDPLDVDDLAACLDRLATEPGLLERLQSAIAEPRSFAAYVDDLEAYYEGSRPGRVAEEGEPDGRALSVRWKGDHGLPSSLSIINDRVCERLGARGARVQRVALAGRAIDPPLPYGADVEVRHQWPPDLSAPSAARLAVIQPWEFGAVPRDWVTAMKRHVDELWVPSDYVRQMYIAGGIDPDRVHTVPNGVDLERFSPTGRPYPLDPAELRFLFVGGLVNRKGPDLLFEAFREAFAGREDVLLVVKTAGAKGVYREDLRDPIAAHAASGALPRVQMVEKALSDADMAALYRACDVFVHPYRGEGFAMPVLEAMACGLPAIVTCGGPTDEFCPPEASWQLRSERLFWAAESVAHLRTVGHPWLLEPDAGHLVELLLAAAGDPEALAHKGRAARAAAERLSWDAVSELYATRLRALSARPAIRALEPSALQEDVALRVLATPAWRGEDRLGELLAEWCAASEQGTSACLYLLADPAVDGSPEEIEARVLASGADLERAADVTILMEPINGARDRSLHAAVHAYVPLHGACEGHKRLGREAGNAILALGNGELARLLEGRARVAQAA